jgi:RNA polymerase sigma factor (sigma-70 family)
MTSNHSMLVRQLRQAILRSDCAALTDGQLLERYLLHRDEDAFEALVRRHEPMVLGVCRRILGHEQDAEDAFQAVFLVLLRKAESIEPREMVANWLHGVACHTARKGRALADRRRCRERQVIAMPERPTSTPAAWDDLRPVLDRELCRLPEKYRAPVILCDLEGKTRQEAARQLGWPAGTVSGRLARARAMLARRLARQGLTLSGSCLAMVLAEQRASAGVVSSAVAAVRAAMRMGIEQAAAGGALSAGAVALAEGVFKAMFLNKLKLTLVLFLLVAVAGLAGNALPSPNASQAREGPDRPAGEAPPRAGGLRSALESFSWGLLEVDPDKRILKVRMLTDAHCLIGEDVLFHQLEGQLTWSNQPVPMTPAGSRLGIDNLPVAAGAKVFIDGKEGNLAGLRVEMRLSLRFEAGATAVARIDARSERPGGEVILKAVDADAKTLTVTIAGKEVTLAVAANTPIAVNTGKAGLAALEPGMRLSLTLGVDRDRLVVTRVLARKVAS